MEQIIQVTGALLILVAYALAQAKVLDQKSLSYLILNIVGAAVLAVLAWRGREWGFLLLEGAWTLVSVAALVGRTARESTRRASDEEDRG